MFADRKEAGRLLAERLLSYRERKDVIVLALPRGGVVTGYEIAAALSLPLDVLLVRKIGYPDQPELAVGAVSETGRVVLNRSLIEAGNVPKEYIDREIEQEQEEIRRRLYLYRRGRPVSGLEGKTIILVDDGIATGATIKAAISTLKQEGIARLVVAAPVAPPSTAQEISSMADEFVCIDTPYDFGAVGSYYQDFAQVSDVEVVDLLGKARQEIT